MAFWAGNNGGNTSRGVSSDAITVVYAQPGSHYGDADTGQYAQDLVKFFNDRFEFYGRRIVLRNYAPQEADSNQSTSVMQADAQAIQAGFEPFAETSYQDDQNGESGYFYDALARERILSVRGQLSELSKDGQEEFTRYAPYEWSYVQGPDAIERNYAEIVCKSLQGRPPRFAGSPTSLAGTRKWAVVYETYTDGAAPLGLEPLMNGLHGCGISPLTIGFPYQSQESPTDAQNAVTQMQAAGVTSVLFFGHPGMLAFHLFPSASNSHFYPEWYLDDFVHNDSDDIVNAPDKAQSTHLMALMSYNKYLPAADMPYDWAVKEVDPNANVGSTINFSWLYLNLLVLASGIQMSGPNLTPAAFESGLFRTSFSDPGAGGPPYYQGRVGFAPGDHAMVQDFALAWGDPAAHSVQEPGAALGTVGTWCWVDHGARYSLGEWPRSEPRFQQPPCDS